MSSFAAQTTLEAALYCAKCKSKATFVEEYTGPEFAPGEIVIISCPRSSHCKVRPWCFCSSCKGRFYFSGLTKHNKTAKHVRRSAAANQPTPAQPNPAPPPNFLFLYWNPLIMASTTTIAKMMTCLRVLTTR